MGIFARISGPNLEAKEIYWMPVQKLEAYNERRPRLPELLRSLDERVGLALAEDRGQKIGDGLLSAVPIARDAEVIGEPLGWLLPFDRRELCLDPASWLHVRNRIPLQGGSQSIDVIADASGERDQRVLALAKPDAAADRSAIQRLQSAAASGHAKVEAVYVDHYQFYAMLCQPPTAPGDAGLPGGGHP